MNRLDPTIESVERSTGRQLIDEARSLLSGRAGVADSVLSPIVFVGANAIFGLQPAIVASLVTAAGIVLVRSDPRDVVGAIQLSRATYRKMIQNLVWATAYNLVAIPVAAGMLVPWGFDMPMAAGAVAMSASTIIVAANAQLLRRLRLGPEPARHPTISPQPA